MVGHVVYMVRIFFLLALPPFVIRRGVVQRIFFALFSVVQQIPLFALFFEILLGEQELYRLSLLQTMYWHHLKVVSLTDL